MSSMNFFNHIDPEVKRILKNTLNGNELQPKEALKLLRVTGKELLALQFVADQLCYNKKQDIVTFIVNRNINFTNICIKKCKFCSFSVPKGSKEGFLLTIEEIKRKVIEAKENGCNEVCIQGGINPDLTPDYYFEVLKTVKKIDQKIHIHAFSPQEIWTISEYLGVSLEDTLRDLKRAGLDSIPGTAAEILVDNIRKVICPNKISTEQWINIIRTAHELRIPSTSTIMYGHIESLKDRIEHLKILRDIQKETRGFTEFVPLPFVKDKPILTRMKHLTINNSHGLDDLKLFCVARIFFNDHIDNIQCSWVKLGPKFAQVSLNYGVNDFSGTLMEENISKSAGARHGEWMKEEEIVSIIKSAGKRPARRTTLYEILKYY